MGRISKADHFLIMSLWKQKKWGAKRLIKEFLGKALAEDKYYSSASKIDNYATIERKSGKHINDVIVTSQTIAVNK